MTAYRKRPVEVAAFCTSDPWPAWGANLLTRGVVRPGPVGVCDWTIDTLEGPMRVKVGDWIVLGVEGEVYAVKPSIFAKTYEPVPAATAPQSTDALLPCPFCGGAVKLEQTVSHDPTMGQRQWWGVVCRSGLGYGGTCAVEIRPSASREAATERWNTRSQGDRV